LLTEKVDAMPIWGTVVLSIVTLVLGAILTMIGQARSDRRTEERARLARREEFLTNNFDMHRSAMLDMQELVRDLFAAYQGERRRRDSDGFYQYMKDFPIRDSVQKISSRTELIFNGIDAVKNAPAGAERDALVEASMKELKESRREMQALGSDFEKMSTVMEGLYPFWGEFAQFSTKMRLCMFRSGSNSVVYSGEAFIHAVFKWTEYYLRNDDETALAEKVEVSYSGANRALSNALKFGPYDKYEDPQAAETDWSGVRKDRIKTDDLISELKERFSNCDRNSEDDDGNATLG
jgi:hypothetical protein